MEDNMKRNRIIGLSMMGIGLGIVILAEVVQNLFFAEHAHGFWNVAFFLIVASWAVLVRYAVKLMKNK